MQLPFLFFCIKRSVLSCMQWKRRNELEVILQACRRSSWMPVWRAPNVISALGMLALRMLGPVDDHYNSLWFIYKFQIFSSTWALFFFRTETSFKLLDDDSWRSNPEVTSSGCGWCNVARSTRSGGLVDCTYSCRSSGKPRGKARWVEECVPNSESLQIGMATVHCVEAYDL